MERFEQSSPVSQQLLLHMHNDVIDENWITLMTPNVTKDLSTLLQDISLLSPKASRRTSKVRRSLFRTSCKRRVDDLNTDGISQKKFCFGLDGTAHHQKTSPKLKPGNDDKHKVEKRLLDTESLIGDGSRPYRLPTIPGKHSDLKSISPQTMVDVLAGNYSDIEYQIIDCRYPYEYHGGHIQGAENIFTDDGILELLHRKVSEENANNKRRIIIFHCEFSSERGPKKYRFLRNKDRQLNQENYPNLRFPEMYILDGGYSEFYKQFETCCEPNSYIPMLDKSYSDDLRHFRKKSKTWSAGDKRRLGIKGFRI